MFKLNINENLQYYTIDEFEKTGLVKHCFTTRKGGVSQGPYESMNLRMNSGDARENITKNYKIICYEIGVNFKDLVFSKQTHSDKIYRVGKKDCGSGIIKPLLWDSCDALMTNEPGVPIITFSADCASVFFLDTKKRAIALAHSGWRGTAARIAEKTVRKMTEEFGSAPEDIIAAIAPSIGKCHLEVGDEVANIFRSEFGEEVLEKREKYHIDMQRAIEIQLEGAGVKNIINSGICTVCESELLFSHRKTGDSRGVMAAIMELK